MSGVNKVILVGNLGQDPEMRHTSGGTAVVNMSIATSRKWTTKSGEQKEDTQWHRVIIWGKQGENCDKYLAKGKQVYIEGRLQTRQWEDKEGQKRWTTEVVAEQVVFLSGVGSSNTGRDEPPPVDDDDVPF